MTRLALTLSLVLFPSLALATEAAAPPPLAFLLGHCWQATFADGRRDIQCFKSVYGGDFVSNSQMRLGGSGGMQEQTRMFYTDRATGEWRFHSYASDGGVGTGAVTVDGKEVRITERQVDKAGKSEEFESVLRRESEFAYSHRTRQKVADGWQDRSAVRYTREDAPETKKELARIATAQGTWGLFWNSNRNGKWHVFEQDAQGNQKGITRHGGNDWLWSTRDGKLFALTTDVPAGQGRGWRGRELRQDGSVVAPIGNESLADGFLDCAPGGGRCAAEVTIDKKKRIAWFTADGSRAQLLGDGTHEDADPQFSSDGKRLLFRSNRSGSWEIHLADADGRNARKLTSDPRNDGLARGQYGGEGPARFSADDTRIVWMRRFPGEGYDVWVMQADGSKARNLTPGNPSVDDGYPSFSPDGRSIAFDSNRTGDSEIFVMDASGGNARRITYTPGADLAAMWVRLAPDAAK